MTRLCVVALLSFAVACGDDDGTTDPMEDSGTDQGMVDSGPPECLAMEPPTDPGPGNCEAVIIDEEATLPVGDDAAGGYIVPGAKRVTRVGEVLELPGFPLAVYAVPGTAYALVTDGGVAAEQLSVVDLVTMTVVDQRVFRRSSSEATYLGIDGTSDGSKVFVSGGGTNMVWVYDFDTSTGQLTDQPAIELAATTDEGYVGDLELLADDRTLVATLLFGAQVVWWDTETDAEIARLPLIEDSRPFGIEISPDESMGYVSLWDEAVIVPIDMSTRTASDPIMVGKNPEGLALSPDGSTLAVADSDSDSLSLIDVGTETRTQQLFIDGETALRGASPAEVAFAPDGRLFVVNAGENAIDVFEADTYARVGRIPTMWYPTDVVVIDDATSPLDGAVLIVNGKHEGTGANTDPGSDDILDLVGGSLIKLEAGTFDDDDLAAWDLEIEDNNTRATGFLDVDCGGADYDFPIPEPGMGASSVIEHVILVVRENKTYDAYFGDLTDADGAAHGNGDPDLVLIPSDEMDQVIPNTRKLALEFAMGDNYYSLAEQSVQGHIRTTWGRSSDFVERSWLTTWGRAFYGIPLQGTATPLGYPEEGSVFDYFATLDFIDVDNFGEIVSARNQAPDGRYPGLVYNMGIPDIEKAQWIQEQVHENCRLKDFTYVLMPNDHTFGRQAGRPTPKAMMADNDWGVGHLVDAISHSTFWESTVIFVIQDDPQDGGDHVDNHRSPLLVISPWAKRGYVSSVHYNESSIYRTIQLILGIENPLNAEWAAASPMYDVFTSTPDFTPYDEIERVWPEEDNPGDGAMAAESAMWDFSMPDEQPGLSRLLWRHLRGTEPPWSIRDELLEILEEEAEDDD